MWLRSQKAPKPDQDEILNCNLRGRMWQALLRRPQKLNRHETKQKKRERERKKKPCTTSPKRQKKMKSWDGGNLTQLSGSRAASPPPMAACCPGSGQVQTKMRPFFSKPANSMPLSSRGERGSFFFPLPKCILIPLFYILISLKKKKSVSLKKNVTLFCKIQQLPWQQERLAGIIPSFDKTTISGHGLKNR
jgi:hypothetical protein